jgi:hypothetical protein
MLNQESISEMKQQPNYDRPKPLKKGGMKKIER